MSTAKLLKQASKLLIQNQLDDANEIAESVLEDEPNNINGLLIKSSCLQRRNQHEQCIEILQRVISLDNNSLAALKGLARSYYFLKKPIEYFDIAVETLLVLSKLPSGLSQERAEDEAKMVFENMKKFLLFNTKKTSNYTASSFNGDSTKIAAEKFLELQIPPLSYTCEKITDAHNFLETLSPPVLDPHSLSELIYYRQKSVDQKLAAITARTKQTIGYKGIKSQKDSLQAIDDSHLLDLLRLQTDTEDDDEVRRAAESQLLDLMVTKLKIIFENEKLASKLQKPLVGEIRDLVDRMAMFEPAKPLAWELAWDWDFPSLESKDYLKDKKEKMKTNKGNTASNSGGSDDPANDIGYDGEEDLGTPVERKDSKSQEIKSKTPLTVYESVLRYRSIFAKTSLGRVLQTFLNRSKKLSCEALTAYKGDSVFGWLICAKFLLQINNLEATIDASHHGLAAVKKRKELFDMQLDEASLQFKLFLASAYTHFQAPKNIGLASDLYDEVLDVEPNSIEAMIGKGMILSQQGDHERAMKVLQHVVNVNPSSEIALGELSWLFIQRGDTEAGIKGLKRCISVQNTPRHNAELKFRIGYAYRSQGEHNKSFEYFVAALNESQTYAPAFTYLGLFFEDISKDKQRAQRCYYRALELDHGELIAGERLASDFAINNQWDLVEIITSTVLSSSSLKGKRNVDWPYRAMGIVCLNQLRYDEAVKYFQRCLRSQSSDVQAWIGLGEAYIHSGRYRSAEKALLRALKLEPSSFSALYVLSLAQREMLDFPGSAKSLQLAIEYAPEFSIGLQWALIDNSIRAADYFIRESKFGDALKEIEQALVAINKSVNADPTEIFWCSAAEVILHLIDMGYGVHGKVLPDHISQLINELGGSSMSLQDSAEQLSLKYFEKTVDESKPRKVSAHAIAARALEMNNKPMKAIEHYQAAISLEPRNEHLWNSYGTSLQSRNPEVAQHCFIRALSLNGRNADTWVNLAGLYLVVNDAELALEAIDRALSLEPEHPRAWVAQALAETILQTKPNESIYRTLEYAYLLSSNDKLANISLALKEYEVIPTKSGNPSPASLGALTKLLQMHPNHEKANFIMGLLLEMQGDYETSLEHLLTLKAWPHVARVQLALKQYDEVLLSCQNIDMNTASTIERLSGLITSGLAHFFLQDYNSAIERFTEALGIVPVEQEENVLRRLIEVLYASHDPDARQVAQDQLFASIEEHGPTLQVTLLLGAIGILENDDMVKEAAKQELEALKTPELKGEPLAQTCEVLALIDSHDNSYQRAVFQWPTDYSLWRRVNKQQALLIAESQSTDALQLSTALVEAGSLVNAQRAVMLDPTSEIAWNALASEVAQI